MWVKQTVKSGFTIVELLIVIVVIGILAAIIVVAYNGVQTRATNAAVITAAKNTRNFIAAYKEANGTYPSLGGYCLTVDNDCTNFAGVVLSNSNTSFLDKLRTIGQPVGAVPKIGTVRYGVYFDGYAPRTYNHETREGLLMYWLKGQDQPCQLQDIAMSDPSPLPGETNAFISSTSPWTGTNSTYTTCYISI